MDATENTQKERSKGRRTTLTMAIATELERHWSIANETILTDDEICCRVGVKLGQLKGWLHRNQKPRGEGGLVGGVGLRTIRDRARGNLKLTYLQSLTTLAKDAEASGDYRTAAQTKQWMAAKQFPTVFGDRQRIDVGPATDTGVAVVPADMTPEEWDRAHRAEVRLDRDGASQA